MRKPRQLELFSDGARAVAAGRAPRPPQLDEARLQAKLDGARQRLREIIILRMKTWLSEGARMELRETERWAREQVRVHHRILERCRAGQRQRQTEPEC
jgi:hypothetical protein